MAAFRTQLQKEMQLILAAASRIDTLCDGVRYTSINADASTIRHMVYAHVRYWELHSRINLLMQAHTPPTVSPPTYI